MTGDHHRRNPYPAGIVLSLLLLLAAGMLATFAGRSGRTMQPMAGKRVVTVNNPVDVYRRWRGAGQRGRVVVSLSRWLNFVDIDTSGIIPGRNPQPLRVTNLAREGEKQISDRNFLALAVLNGVAREVIHVVPDADYPDRVAAVRQVEGARARAGDILVPYRGTPRRITTLKGLTGSGEPVLLYLNASYFRDQAPEDVAARLKGTGVRADDIVLCLSADDVEVTERERERLRRFAEILGSGGI